MPLKKPSYPSSSPKRNMPSVGGMPCAYITQLFAGQLINGCIIAFYPICASAYVGEVTPLVLRGFAATMTNLAFSIGSLIASGILKGTETMDSQWSYKIPIATQWALPCIMLLL